ncbi:MAG: PAP/fibrillin family protein [Leptolyngbyaceae cyanobacterium MO_188.B28]|nr:PAP/fibrillin family protein [Leptolyngbyaceae cyanobacterium MO_188.B28]
MSDGSIANGGMETKANLQAAIADNHWGASIGETEQKAILALIEQLEKLNPTPQPIKATELLEGDWRLLYTTSQELFRINQFPLLRSGPIYQCVRPTAAKVYNIAEIFGVPGLEGVVSVAAQLEPVSDQRVNVKFERAVFGLQRLMGYQSPAGWIQKLKTCKQFPWLQAIDFPINRGEQRGWIEITYLDHNMRITRGNQGSVFVLTK